MPANFDDQLEVVAELVREIARMESAEKRIAGKRGSDAYEQELRLAGLAQRISQSYTVIEGVLNFVARRIDGEPVTGEDWHKKLLARCVHGYGNPGRPPVISEESNRDLLELCEFRHVIRNIYPTRLEAARVQENLRRLIRAVRRFQVEVAAFSALSSRGRKRIRGRSKAGT